MKEIKKPLSVAGCHFKGPVALRRRLSSALPLSVEVEFYLTIIITHFGDIIKHYLEISAFYYNIIKSNVRHITQFAYKRILNMSF